MTKLKKIIIVIVSVIVVALFVEATTYCIQSARLKREGYRFANDANKPPYPTNISMFSKYYLKHRKNDLFQNFKGIEYKTNSILVFGDVFANSFALTEENNFTAKLSDYTQRPVLNLADAGWSIPHMYYLLKNEPILRAVNHVDTIIFVYNDYMKERLTSFSYYPHHDYLYLNYEISDGVLVEKIPQLRCIYNSYFIRALERFWGNLYAHSKNPNKQQKLFQLMKSLFVQSRFVASYTYPEFEKFVILRYVPKWRSLQNIKSYSDDPVAQLEYNLWKQLAEEGFIIIDIPEFSESIDYTSPEYVSSDSSPTDRAWDEIIPKLVEKL